MHEDQEERNYLAVALFTGCSMLMFRHQGSLGASFNSVGVVTMIFKNGSRDERLNEWIAARRESIDMVS